MAAVPQHVAAAPSERRGPRRQGSSPPQRPLQLVPPRRRSGQYVALMVLLAALGVFGCVALNALAAEQSFAVRELEVEVRDLSRQADELMVEVTRLESPARLERTATRQLGMVPARRPGFVALPRSASKDSRESSRIMAAPTVDEPAQ